MDRSLIDDRARWLAVRDLRPAVVPAPLADFVRAVAAARPKELSGNDPVPDVAAERQAAALILIATDRDGGPDVLCSSERPISATMAVRSAFRRRA